MLSYLVIFIGGGLGASLRHSISLLAHEKLGMTYPYGTFIINILGSLFLGFIVALAFNKTNLISPNLKLFLTVGFAGGFTTFSTFSYETLTLIKQGQVFAGMLYVLLSIIIGVMAVFLGMQAAKYIM